MPEKSCAVSITRPAKKKIPESPKNKASFRQADFSVREMHKKINLEPLKTGLNFLIKILTGCSITAVYTLGVGATRVQFPAARPI